MNTKKWFGRVCARKGATRPRSDGERRSMIDSFLFSLLTSLLPPHRFVLRGSFWHCARAAVMVENAGWFSDWLPFIGRPNSSTTETLWKLLRLIGSNSGSSAWGTWEAASRNAWSVTVTNCSYTTKLSLTQRPSLHRAPLLRRTFKNWRAQSTLFSLA